MGRRGAVAPPSPAQVIAAVSEGEARGGPLAPPKVGGAPYLRELTGPPAVRPKPEVPTVRPPAPPPRAGARRMGGWHGNLGPVGPMATTYSPFGQNDSQPEGGDRGRWRDKISKIRGRHALAQMATRRTENLEARKLTVWTRLQ